MNTSTKIIKIIYRYSYNILNIFRCKNICVFYLSGMGMGIYYKSIKYKYK